jgi:hypothetical protein
MIEFGQKQLLPVVVVLHSQPVAVGNQWSL